jgi:hypothetical protein
MHVREPVLKPRILEVAEVGIENLQYANIHV